MQNLQVKRIEKTDIIIAGSLFILGMITRVPFVSRTIFEGDSARFAMAMKGYDVAQMRPHAPGYILYVAAAKFTDLFLHDTRVSLIGVSLLSSALAVCALYLLSVQMYGSSNAVISAVLLLTSPLYWFNGEMPFTYALEGFLSVIFALACYQLLCGKKGWLLISGVALGLVTGVRQHIVIMLFPLWLYAMRRYSWKQVTASLLAFGLTCLVWFVPMITLTGGVEKYYAASYAQVHTWVKHPAPFLLQIVGRGKVFAGFMVYSLCFGLLPMLYFYGRLSKIPNLVKDSRMIFLLIWLVPPVLFLIGVNVFNPGHVVVVLPPLFICLAESIKGAAMDLQKAAQKVVLRVASPLRTSLFALFSYKVNLVALVIVLVCVNTYIFLFKETRVSYATIRAGDRHIEELVRLTKESAAPQNAMVLTFLYNTQAGFYLPDYLVYCPFPLMFSPSDVPIDAQNVYVTVGYQTNPKTYWIPTGFKIEPIPVPENIEKVILWEEEITRYFRDSSRPIEEIASDRSDTKIYFFRVKPGEKIYYDYHYLAVK